MSSASTSPNPLPEVFVGCSTEGLRAAQAVQTNMRYAARATIWRQGEFELGHTFLDDLIAAATRSDFAVFVLSPDDLTRSRGAEESAPRDNTIFEAGLFMGILGRDRVFLVVPGHPKVKLPTDLLGITTATYEPPRDDRWESALGPAANQVDAAMRRRPARSAAGQELLPLPGPHYVYPSLKQAAEDIAEACRNSTDLKVLANKGLVFIGTDDSLISTAEIHLYSNLRKLRVLLMSGASRWISGRQSSDGTFTKGLISLRKRESLETYLREIEVAHAIVESGFSKFAGLLSGSRSGVRYFTGEPYWRMVMTETTCFVSNYADDSRAQARDLPVCRFDNSPGSFYSAFKRHFNDIWHNESTPSAFMQSTIDLTISAGGIVYADAGDNRFVLLLCRYDGAWVLPKGSRRVTDASREETAIREVAEESGLPKHLLLVDDLLDSYTDTTHGECKVVSIFKIRYVGGSLPEPKPDVDHARAKWWPVPGDLPTMLYPYQTVMLAEFVDAYQKQVAIERGQGTNGSGAPR